MVTRTKIEVLESTSTAAAMRLLWSLRGLLAIASFAGKYIYCSFISSRIFFFRNESVSELNQLTFAKLTGKLTRLLEDSVSLLLHQWSHPCICTSVSFITLAPPQVKTQKERQKFLQSSSSILVLFLFFVLLKTAIFLMQFPILVSKLSLLHILNMKRNIPVRTRTHFQESAKY